MQPKIESLALDLLNHLESSRTIDFSTIKELLGSDDKASRALRYLLENGKIVELDRSQWKIYGIKESDRRKNYYVLAEDDFANREWKKVKGVIEEATGESDREHGRELASAILSVLPLPSYEVHVTRMSRFRNREDIGLLLKLYSKLAEWNIDQDYRGRWTILGFIHGCVASGTLMIGDLGRGGLSITLKDKAHDALAEMLHANGNALNVASPMAVAFEAFRIAVTLDQSGIIKWIGDELNRLLGLIESGNVMNINDIFVFQNMIEHYRTIYPDAFRLESVDELSMTLLEMILDRKTRPEMRNVLQAIRRSLIQ